jgi:hypothetical protein
MNHHFAVDQVVNEILTPKSLNRMMEVSEKKSEKKSRTKSALDKEEIP